MLNGIISSQVLSNAGGGGGGEPNPYPTSLAYLNFRTNKYWVGANQVIASAVIDNPSEISASGLYLGNVLPQLVGSALAAFSVDYATFVVEYKRNGFTGNRIGMTICDAGVTAGFEIWNNSTSYAADVFGSGFSLSLYDDTGGYLPDVLRLAVTRTTGKLALSGNGRATVTSTGTDGTISPEVVSFGNFPGNSPVNGHVHEVILFAPQVDGDLPTLSTIA